MIAYEAQTRGSLIQINVEGNKTSTERINRLKKTTMRIKKDS